MEDGFYWIRFGSYKEYGPYPTWAECYDAGVEGCWYSTDFSIQQWRGGNTVREWRDVQVEQASK